MTALMLALLASRPTLAVEPTAELETVAQVRHDLFGESNIPLWQYLRLRKEVHGAVAYGFGVDAYLGLEWASGLDQPSDFDIYSLNVEGEEYWGQWRVGRQQAFAATRPQTFDGASLTRRVSDRLSFGGWAGMARHQDLDDLSDGVSIARLDANIHQGGLVARAGAQIESGPETEFILRQDAEGRMTFADAALAPDITGRLVVAEPEPTVEWARLEAGIRPVSAVRTSVHAQHREAADPTSLFGDALLQSLAGGAVNEAGAGLRVSGQNWAVLSASWSAISYGPDEDWWGHEVDLSWAPGVTDRTWRVVPGYMFRSGPGGLFHAGTLNGQLALADRANLGARVAVVPFRSGHAPWDLVLAGGADARVEVAQWLSTGLFVDAASDRLYELDVRGGAVLTLAVP